jgi:hypothetical protein
LINLLLEHSRRRPRAQADTFIPMGPAGSEELAHWHAFGNRTFLLGIDQDIIVLRRYASQALRRQFDNRIAGLVC